ncbi:MAG: AMP-binding protein [Candidatus Omnitrophica bacterium]|nr:AMP-binding protein [Candidatus Omnitrophota bacterium]
MIDSMVKDVLKNITIRDVLEAINKKYGNKTALRIKNEDGSFREISYLRLGRRAVSISSALMNLGVDKGDRVAILSENRPEWAAAYFGIISCGAVILPVDVKLTDNEIKFILNDSEAKCIFVSEKYLGAVDRLRPALPHLKRTILFDKTGREDLAQLGKLRIHRGKGKERISYPDDTAIIVYTSGTTGISKGVEISYKNLLFQMLEFSRTIRCTPKERLLSVLPLNHMLEITGGLIAPLYAGSCVTYCDTLKTNMLLPLMREVGTTAIICVPLVLKLILSGIRKKAAKLPPLKRHIFNAFLALSRFLLKFRIRAGRLLFRAVHKEFGGRLHTFISGGAPLDTDVEIDMNALGFRILQGYGLTETAPVISVNTFSDNRFGSVGKPLPGVEVRILKEKEADAAGEILTRGPHVMKGYFKNPEKTAEAIKDGWFYTGDLGYLDKDGFLYISGRKKNMIILGGGKKVFPEEIEAVMANSPYIKEICVLPRIAARGLREGHEEVYAIVVPNLEMFEREKDSAKEAVELKISSEISRLGKELSAYKRIVNFDVYYGELPKTVTKKIKRDAVAEMAKDL